MIPKVAGWKKDSVSELADIFGREGSIAVIDVAGVPASNMIDMRNTLRDRMSITMAKKSLMRIAWLEAERSAEELESLLENAEQPCVVHSEAMNAFEIFSELEKTRQGRPAKEGEEISADLGIMLTKLKINPIEIGLILTGVIENGFMFPASDLDLDTDGFRNDIINATSGAFNLACNMRWFSSTTTPTLISRASSEAMAVAIEASIVNDATTSFLLSQARSRALSLAGQVDSSALDDELAAALGAVAQSADVAPSEATKSEATSQKGVSTEQEEEEEGGAGFEGLGDLFG